MGMFDSLTIKCKCGKTLEFQSKTGHCGLFYYNKQNVPVRVLVGMQEDVVECSHCGAFLKLDFKIPHPKIKIKEVRKPRDNHYYPGN